MLPNQEILKKVSRKIENIPNRQGEYKRKIHYGCYLLCSQSGLRISEAVKFDLSAKNKHGLYRINKPKGKKERFVYVSPSVINQLKKNNWQPNQTNRFNFYHFLRKIKWELNIIGSIELTPHTLRRSFTTYHANSGVPLPLLQKLLGHSSIRTTALYWHDTDEDGNHNAPDILQVKKWLEKRETPKPPLITENFPEAPKRFKPIFTADKPTINSQKPSKQYNSPSLIKTKEKQTIANYQPETLIGEILTKKQEKSFLNTSEQLPLITTHSSKGSEREQILLERIKILEGKLAKIRSENNQLKLENRVLAKQNEVSAKQNQHLKALISQDQATEAKVVQLPTFKK